MCQNEKTNGTRTTAGTTNNSSQCSSPKGTQHFPVGSGSNNSSQPLTNSLMINKNNSSGQFQTFNYQEGGYPQKQTPSQVPDRRIFGNQMPAKPPLSPFISKQNVQLYESPGDPLKPMNV